MWLKGTTETKSSSRSKTNPDIENKSKTRKLETIDDTETQQPTKKSKNVKTSRGSSTQKTSNTKLKNNNDSEDVDDIEDLDVSISTPKTLNDIPVVHQKIALHYELVKKMRSLELSPVDTMGCHATGDKTASPATFRFQTLVALLLSSQTKDEVTFNAVKNLRERLTGGCTPQGILDNPDEAHNCIKSVGFHNKKIENLKKIAQICKDDYNNDIPSELDELMDLPGVGPKMANLVMSSAWDKVEGIGVDVHMQRILNSEVLNWFPKAKNTTPEKTRAALQVTLPHKFWAEVNTLFVGFGQLTCSSQRPRCHKCVLATTGLCPSQKSSMAKNHNLQSPIQRLIAKYKADPNSVKIGDFIHPEFDSHPTEQLIRVDQTILDILHGSVQNNDDNDNTDNLDEDSDIISTTTPSLYQQLKNYIVPATIREIWDISDQKLIEFWDNSIPNIPFVPATVNTATITPAPTPAVTTTTSTNDLTILNDSPNSTIVLE